MGLLSEIRRTTQHVRRGHLPHPVGTPVLQVADLTVQYGGGLALEDLSFELRAGGRTAVVGPNGAGKSTLFKIIAGVITPTAGAVQVYGNEPGGHICIAYVPQRSQVDWSFPASVSDVVLMGRVGRMGLLRHALPRDWEIVWQALSVVGLEELSQKQIGQLSGGQQQRMFIARALAQEAELMLMDEPLTGLDAAAQESIFRILDDLERRGVTVMVALHDLKLAAERFRQVMLLNRRLVGFGPPEEVLVRENLLQAYGGHLHLLPSEDGLLALGDTCCDQGVVEHV